MSDDVYNLILNSIKKDLENYWLEMCDVNREHLHVKESGTHKYPQMVGPTEYLYTGGVTVRHFIGSIFC